MADCVDCDRVSARVCDVIADELGAASCFMQALVGMVSYIDADGNRSWLIVAPPDQFFDTTLGLTGHLHAWHKEVQRLLIQEALTCDEDED